MGCYWCSTWSTHCSSRSRSRARCVERGRGSALSWAGTDLRLRRLGQKSVNLAHRKRKPMARLAIVGMACRFPDAENPRQLWENVLAGRRAFRPLPEVRLNSTDYYAADPATPDRHYATHAAVIESWRFDQTKHRVAGNVYRST